MLMRDLDFAAVNTQAWAVFTSGESSNEGSLQAAARPRRGGDTSRGRRARPCGSGKEEEKRTQGTSRVAVQVEAGGQNRWHVGFSFSERALQWTLKALGCSCKNTEAGAAAVAGLSAATCGLWEPWPSQPLGEWTSGGETSLSVSVFHSDF